MLLLAAGIVVNAVLAFVKLYVGLSSNSLAIMLDSVNSFFDILTGIVTVLAFCLLLRMRSEYVPHGYGRAEYLASFVVAAVSAVVGGIFFMRSLNRWALPEPVWFGAQSCALICAAIPVKLAMGLTFHFLNKRKLHSKAMQAIALDSFLDVGMTTASLISFVVSSVVNYAVDAVFGMIMSVVIMVFAVKMVVDSVKSVIVGDVTKEEIARVKDEAGKLPCVLKVDGVSIHDYGYGEKIATVCVQVKKGTSLEELDEQRQALTQAVADMTQDEYWPQIMLVPKLADDDDIAQNDKDVDPAGEEPSANGASSSGEEIENGESADRHGAEDESSEQSVADDEKSEQDSADCAEEDEKLEQDSEDCAKDEDNSGGEAALNG